MRTDKPRRKPTGVFSFLVPVTVGVVRGRVTNVSVDDGTAPRLPDGSGNHAGDASLFEGDDLAALLAAANDDDWPAWEFGQ